jgi:serine phosphatase RsbU (regulator of sigma subunit)
MCGSGRVTRVAVADVSGHGPTLDQVARWLRNLMRKYINHLDQTRFARAVNREFTDWADSDYFATVLLATYFAPTDHLIICNAGHPRPIWFSQRRREWTLLDLEVPDPGPSIRQAQGTYGLRPVANLPLGVIEPTDYYQFDVRLERGDVVIIYTDALPEAKRPDGRQLGEQGLLEIVREVGLQEPPRIIPALLERVDAWRSHAPPDDDQTVIVLHHNASDPPRVTVGSAARSVAKMLGLSRV